jgi:hypothetical protein
MQTCYKTVPLTLFASCRLFLEPLGASFENLCAISLLQDHRETDRFFPSSGVQLLTSNQFHLRRAAFYSQLKSKVGNILAKAAVQSKY